jgi:phytoene dehydrogenase-like protein
MGAAGHDAVDAIVVGAGIAGLVCATELARAGRRVVVLERADGVGGRVRTRRVDGHLLDRGFQVLFTAYPTLNAYLDHDALALRRFLPAARIAGEGRPRLVGDGLRAPELLPSTLADGALGWPDLLRLLALRRLAAAQSVEACLGAPWDGVSARALLEARGFSDAALRRFFAPFYGGILLDPELRTSAGVLLFTLKMLAEGDTAVPAAGMGAIAEQLAARSGAQVRTGVGVAAVDVHAGAVRGVTLDDGTRLEAPDVVLAVDAPAAVPLAATAGATLAAPRGALGCATLYWSAAAPPLPGRAIWLNAAPGALVRHAVTLTEVAPEYAPPGRHLLSATVLGDVTGSHHALARRAEAELRAMRGRALPALELLGVERVPYAQYPQPPGARGRRTTPSLGRAGLWLASETAHTSSLEGAARGGQAAARAILEHRRAARRSA